LFAKPDYGTFQALIEYEFYFVKARAIWFWELT